MSAEKTIFEITPAASVTIDPANGEYQKLTNTSESALAITLAQPPAPDDGKWVRVVVFIRDTNAATVSTPITIAGGGSIRWRTDYNGNPVEPAAALHSGEYMEMWEFATVDRGVNWFGRRTVFD
jgi:hypothetical protein